MIPFIRNVQHKEVHGQKIEWRLPRAGWGMGNRVVTAKKYGLLFEVMNMS